MNKKRTFWDDWLVSGQNLTEKLWQLVYEWTTFSRKIGVSMGLLSNSQQHIPTQTKSEYTPPPGFEGEESVMFSSRVPQFVFLLNNQIKSKGYIEGMTFCACEILMIICCHAINI